MIEQRDLGCMHLIVIRHAKSSWDDPQIDDHDRPLSKRGRRTLPRLREHVETLALGPDPVRCSSSRRTRETLDGILPALGGNVRLETNGGLYGARVDQLITILRALDDRVATVILIGHNPGVANLVEVLAAVSATGVATIDAFPTAAVAVLSMAGPWGALQPGCASLDSFWAPRPR